MIEKLIFEMIQYNSGDRKRIAHALKVHSFAKTISKLENLDEHTNFIIESASILHDIGIKVCEEKYGKCSGKLQEKEGPLVAKPILAGLNYCQSDVERILFLIGHHHTYKDIDGTDYQVLIEADFLVNLDEENSSTKTIESIRKNIFKTKSGKAILNNLFDLQI